MLHLNDRFTNVLVLFCLFGIAAFHLPVAGAPPENPGYRSTLLNIQTPGRTGFTLISPADSGVHFTNSLAVERSITNHVLLNGSGVAAGDVDGDGWIDLYFCNLDGANKLFRNLGHWKFTDITDSAGVSCPDLDATGAAFADIDGDGDLDLIVNSIAGGTHIFLNDGHGHFTPSLHAPLLNDQNAGTSLALADMDGDGFLDLYIANYRPMFFFLDKPETRYSVRTVNGQPQVVMIDGKPLTDPEFTNRFVFQVHAANGKVTLGKEELGQVDRLYRNNGQGGFTLVPFTGGAFQDEDGKALLEPPRDWGLSVMFRDLNGDGAPDLYICNDFRTPDRLWLNDGRGHFRAVPRLAIRELCLSAMAMDVADINRDGYFDIFVADMLSTEHSRRLTQRIDLRPETLAVGQIDNRPQFSRNMLQLSRGDGTFAEIAQLAGLEATDWTWSPIFLDVDLDGYEDLIVANGFERDTMNMDVQNRIETITHQQRLGPREKMNLRKLYPRLNTPKLAFRNLGDCRFAEVSAEWGFNSPTISQGVCLADLDNDGDLDVIVNNMNDPAELYRNDSSAPRIAVRLKGVPPNTRGIGAKIEVFGGPVYQSQEMICGGRYCSSDDPMRTFAAGSLTNELQIAVTWRTGKRSVINRVLPNRLYEIDEAGSTAEAPEMNDPKSQITRRAARPDGNRPTAFRDASHLLNHQHHEEAFDDFARQPLLPGKLSQLGPGIAWLDIDNDGRDDLIIGSGRGGYLAVYHNIKDGKFEPAQRVSSIGATERDQTGIVGWRPSETNAIVLAGVSSYEDAQSTGGSVHGFELPSSGTNSLEITRVQDVVDGTPSATGPIALADLDGDGNLDLFVGGRVVPGRYPEPASSRVFRNVNNRFVLDQANTEALKNVGLVSGAVFSDLDGDGNPDLALAIEWGPVRVFHNRHGQLIEVTKELGFDKFNGWWNGISVGDFDGDGRMDIVASNWGRNSKYEHFRQQPLRLYYGDFNGDGGVQLLEAYYDPKLKQLVPWRRWDEVARAIPFLNATFSTFEAFGRASIEQILGDKIGRATVLQANWLESTVFLNRGDHFEATILPFEAQLAPAFGICVGDLDGDGAEDIFLSQNFFDVPSEMSRYDAGRGLWLRGNGHGQFDPVSGSASGLLIYGEQRGAALCDYDADGRLDLAVAQNGAATQLFHNETARPGLRVRLKGPGGNSQGIGGTLRLLFADHLGPLHEVHGGSGYWSQDSVVSVLGIPSVPTGLEVHWPAGRTFKVLLPPNATEIEVDASRGVRAIRP